jgi:LysM repeat protein
MNYSPAPLVALSLLCLVNLASSQGQAPVQIKPIAPSTGTVAPPPIPAPTTPAAPVIPKVVIPASPPVAKPVESAKYVVKAGDNPWKIAKAHGISVEALVKANEIKDSKKLAIGDVLLLPAGVESKGAPAPAPAGSSTPAAATPTPTAGANSELYTIKSGDNPWNIAKRLKVDHQKIISLNPGIDFTKLKIGQQISVPKK